MARGNMHRKTRWNQTEATAGEIAERIGSREGAVRSKIIARLLTKWKNCKVKWRAMSSDSDWKRAVAVHNVCSATLSGTAIQVRD